MSTVAATVNDVAILSALRRGPMSTREIVGAIRRVTRDAWAAELGLDIEWGTDAEPLEARLLASGWARDHGFVLHPWEIYPRLRRLERAGEITRIQIPGHRPMLWRLVATVPSTQEVS